MSLLVKCHNFSNPIMSAGECSLSWRPGWLIHIQLVGMVGWQQQSLEVSFTQMWYYRCLYRCADVFLSQLIRSCDYNEDNMHPKSKMVTGKFHFASSISLKIWDFISNIVGLLSNRVFQIKNCGYMHLNWS